MLRSAVFSEHTRVNILIVGTNRRARELAEILSSAKKWGYRVMGHLRLKGETKNPRGMEIMGTVDDLPSILQNDNVPDEVIFTGTSQGELQRHEVMINLCQELGIKTRVASDLLPASASKISLEFLDNLPLITFSNVPDHGFSLVFKRIIDLTCSMIGLVLLSPLMLVTALAIKLTSPGPVFYKQTRCGLYGRRFKLTKFRTMVDGAEDRLWEIKHLNEMDGPVFKMRNDPRVTPLGNILRKSSIDELPQLWNVIKGEMSIVGPRAPLLEEVRHYSTSQRRRLSVKPGITCLWQVSGRSNVSFQRWMDMDLEYIDNWSVWLDLVIMLKTIPAVFTGRGAR
jgi:exopolysaccharide biosynthesis polyprenyl glycosylphosphotransferase